MGRNHITLYDASQVTTPIGTAQSVAQTQSYLLRPWRDHTALRDTLFPVRLQHDLQQVQHIVIVDPLGYLGEEQIVPHPVEIGLQINVDNACLPLRDRISNPDQRLMR